MVDIKGKELKSQIPLPVKLFSVRLDKIDKALFDVSIELEDLEESLAKIEEYDLRLIRKHLRELRKKNLGNGGEIRCHPMFAQYVVRD